MPVTVTLALCSCVKGWDVHDDTQGSKHGAVGVVKYPETRSLPAPLSSIWSFLIFISFQNYRKVARIVQRGLS